MAGWELFDVRHGRAVGRQGKTGKGVDGCGDGESG
jgi:hypothetical protein